MINCLIIDDDAVSANLIKHFIQSTEGLSFLEAITNPVEAANFIRKNAGSIDLIFLDVEMPEMTGLELLDTFKELPPVILITSKEKYAARAFEYQVLHYLVKPVEYGKFLKAMERVFELFRERQPQQLDYIFIKSEGLLNKVNHKEIHYCEALGDYVKLHTKDKVHTINSTMKNLEDKLRTSPQFIRIHRSFIINLNCLENFDNDTAIVAGKIIPIGNKFRAGLQERLNII